MVKPVSIKKLNNGTLLIEVDKKTYSDNLLNMKFFTNIKIKSYAHSSLNSSMGVVRSSELSLSEIKSHLKTQSVTDVKRITFKRNDSIILTDTYILTFGKPQIPKELKVSYTIVKVNPYIPNPLRCNNCQKFQPSVRSAERVALTTSNSPVTTHPNAETAMVLTQQIPATAWHGKKKRNQ